MLETFVLTMATDITDFHDTRSNEFIYESEHYFYNYKFQILA